MNIKVNTILRNMFRICNNFQMSTQQKRIIDIPSIEVKFIVSSISPKSTVYKDMQITGMPVGY